MIEVILILSNNSHVRITKL